MDPRVRAAMQQWPNVPALYGWLGLDETGHWRLQGEPITHPGLVDFINRNYACDERGCWFFQNGPQRGFVQLAYTPWVLHIDAHGHLRRHTRQPVAGVRGAYIDEDQNLLLDTDAGIGLVEPDALAALTDGLVDETGRLPQPDDFERVQRGEQRSIALDWQGQRVALAGVQRAEVAARFGFVADPAAACRAEA